MKTLYICSSQFSGSTLTSFLLNGHSRIATIGHTEGWKYKAEDDFRCSCGERLTDCALFVRVREAYERNGLRFNPQDFGTEFRLAAGRRANQILLGPLPKITSSSLERLRDSVIGMIPPYRRALNRQQKANAVLIGSVLEFFGADIYLDNSHSPYRFRKMYNSRDFEVFPIHLIRDPRGVVLSLMTNSGYALEDAVHAWLNHQSNINRITHEATDPLTVYYEELCREPDRELRRIYDYIGLMYEPMLTDFKAQEHHILGNRMRLSAGEIKLDERWRRDLDEQDQKQVNVLLRTFADSNPQHPVSEIVSKYLEQD